MQSYKKCRKSNVNHYILEPNHAVRSACVPLMSLTYNPVDTTYFCHPADFKYSFDTYNIHTHFRYDLMSACWLENKDARPDFSEIVTTLSVLLAKIEKAQHLAQTAADKDA